MCKIMYIWGNGLNKGVLNAHFIYHNVLCMSLPFLKECEDETNPKSYNQVVDLDQLQLYDSLLYTIH